MNQSRRELLRERLTKFRVLAQKYAPLFPNTADRMWAVRNSMDMTQEEFAEMCGMSKGWTSRIECGYGLPKGTTLEGMVKGLGLSADFILCVEDKVDHGVSRKAERFLEQKAEEMRPKRRQKAG